MSYTEDIHGNRVEQLPCKQCGRDWWRVLAKGRKPHHCNDCVELNSRPKDPPLSPEEKVDQLMFALASRGTTLAKNR